MTLHRRAIAPLAALALLPALLAGCSSNESTPSGPSTPGATSPASPSATPSVSASPAPSASASPAPSGGGIALGGDQLPPDWPQGLPPYEGGSLVSAVVTPDGQNVNAVWSTDATPDEAWAQMDAALRAAGFVPVAETGADSMMVEDETQKTDTYLRDQSEVNLVVVKGEKTGVLLNATIG